MIYYSNLIYFHAYYSLIDFTDSISCLKISANDDKLKKKKKKKKKSEF